MRTITNYYNVYKQQWVTGDGTPLLERNWPILNLWETPTLGIHILEDEMQNIVIPEGATFTITFTDAYDNTIAAPVEGTVNNEEYYEDANPELGIFSFMTALDSQEAYFDLSLMEDTQTEEYTPPWAEQFKPQKEEEPVE